MEGKLKTSDGLKGGGWSVRVNRQRTTCGQYKQKGRRQCKQGRAIAVKCAVQSNRQESAGKVWQCK